jgi:hypothetical protein
MSHGARPAAAAAALVVGAVGCGMSALLNRVSVSKYGGDSVERTLKVET